MEAKIRDLEVPSLRAHLDSCSVQCATLAKEFENSKSSFQRTRLARRWDATLKRSYMVHLLVDLIERSNREGRASDLDRIKASFSRQRVRLRRPASLPPALPNPLNTTELHESKTRDAVSQSYDNQLAAPPSVSQTLH